MKKITIFIVLINLFIFLLAFPSIALEASKNSLILWFDILLPTLLPFLVVSQLLLKCDVLQPLQKMMGPIFSKLFHCSEKGVFCMICGFFCGYPVGARLIALEIKDSGLTVEEGQYLLAFCNNVSPIFCISYGIHYAMGQTQIFPFLFIIYGSALIFGLLTRPVKRSDKQKQIHQDNCSQKKQTSAAENIYQLIDVCIIDSFLIMIKLCGYLILFSILSKQLCTILPENPYLTSGITAFLEITGGLAMTSQLPHGIMRMVISITALSLGGLCCIFQTNSVINGSGLSFRRYVIHKGIITLFALFLFCLWYFFGYAA